MLVAVVSYKYKLKAKEVNLYGNRNFFKKIEIDEKAADILIAGLERPRGKHVPVMDIDEVARSANEWLRQRELRLEKSLEQDKK